jgi:hypothetical protein
LRHHTDEVSSSLRKPQNRRIGKEAIMTDTNGQPSLVDIVMDSLVRQFNVEMSPTQGTFLARLLDNFAVSVVQNVAPSDEAGRAEVFDNARSKGIKVEPNEGKPWSKAETDTLQEMRSRGMAIDQIARELKRGNRETDAKLREYEKT